MHVSTLAVVALMLSPAAVAAQNAAGAAVRSPRAFSPFIMEAPPAPDSAAKVLHLTATQKSRYAALRIDYVKKTGAVRDSLRAERQQMQADRGQRRGAAGRVGIRDRMQWLQQSAMAGVRPVEAA